LGSVQLEKNNFLAPLLIILLEVDFKIVAPRKLNYSIYITVF
jgi:hypothetical protein